MAEPELDDTEATIPDRPVLPAGDLHIIKLWDLQTDLSEEETPIFEEAEICA